MRERCGEIDRAARGHQDEASFFLVAGFSAFGFDVLLRRRSSLEESEADEEPLLESEDEPLLPESEEDDELSAARLSRFSCCLSL